MSERIRKVNELLKHEVASALIMEGVGGFVTIKAVETSRDMKQATVWISIIGGNEEEVMSEIEGKRREIQQRTSSTLTSRNVPVLTFKVDHSGEHAQKIEELLKNDSTKS